jgi:hypothetical protein
LKKLKFTLFSGLIASSLYAGPGQLSLYEISPDSYGKQNFTVGFDTYSTEAKYNENNNSNSLYGNQDYLNSINIVMSNKATLKKFGYERGEIYWRGTGTLGFDLENDNSIVGFELGVGLSYNFKYFYTAADIAGEYIGFIYNDKDINNGNERYLKSTFTIGKKILRKVDLGIFSGYDIGSMKVDNIDTELNGYRGGLLITYHSYKDITHNIKLTYSKKESNDIDFSLEESRIMYSFTWKYKN